MEIAREEEAAAVLVGLALLTMLKKPTPTPPPPPDKVTTPVATEPIITPTPPEVSPPPPPPKIVEETPPQPAPAPQPQTWYLVSFTEGIFFWCTVTPPEELPSTLYKYWYTFTSREACENVRWFYQKQAVARCEKYFKDISPWTNRQADCYLDEDAPACNYTCTDETGWGYRKAMRW